MQFALQREVPSKKYPFTTTQFVSWQENENALIVYFGDDTLKEYNKIIIYEQCEIYKTAKKILDEENASAVLPFIQDIYQRNYSYFEKSKPTKEAYEENYVELYHHLWKLPTEFGHFVNDYCPVNNLELLKEWYNLLLKQRFDKYDNRSKELETQIKNDLANYLLTRVQVKRQGAKGERIRSGQ